MNCFCPPRQLSSLLTNVHVEFERKIQDEVICVGHPGRFLKLRVCGVSLVIRNVVSNSTRKEHRLLTDKPDLYTQSTHIELLDPHHQA